MTAQKIATLAELAKLAGVSAATVSRALAGSDLIRAKTRDRIVDLARQHDFRPNELARNLRLKRTLAIGVVLPLGHEVGQTFSDPFFMTILAYLADGLTARGYDLMLSRVIPTDAGWLDRIVSAGRVDGIIVIGQSDQSDVIDKVGQNYAPLVVWGADMVGKSYCSVGSDNKKGGQMATKHLIDQGRENLMFLGSLHAPEFLQRQQGFSEACDEAGIKDAQTLDVHLTAEAAYAALVDYFANGHVPDGIVAASDIIAMSAIRALTEQQLRVPEDVAVIGYDDIPLAQHTSPPLTTIQQDLAQGAELLIDLLFRRIAGEATESAIISPKLIERGSA